MKPITREECREMLQTYDALKRTEQAVSEGAPTESTGPAKVVAAVAAGSALPCPFCGRAPEIKSRASAWNKTGMAYFIMCFCGGNAARAHIHADSQDGAISLWNTRHEPNNSGLPRSGERGTGQSGD